MGISMRATMVTDEQIRELSEDSSRQHELLIAIFHSGNEFCYLADYWDGLHYMLTGRRESSELPLSILKKGDVEFSSNVDFSERYPESTHAIYSTTVKALEVELQNLAESVLPENHNKLNSSFYPGRLWRSPDHDGSDFSELMTYFNRLQNIVTTAAAQNKGLILYRYEDW